MKQEKPQKRFWLERQKINLAMATHGQETIRSVRSGRSFPQEEESERATQLHGRTPRVEMAIRGGAAKELCPLTGPPPACTSSPPLGKTDVVRARLKTTATDGNRAAVSSAGGGGGVIM